MPCQKCDGDTKVFVVIKIWAVDAWFPRGIGEDAKEQSRAERGFPWHPRGLGVASAWHPRGIGVASAWFLDRCSKMQATFSKS